MDRTVLVAVVVLTAAFVPAVAGAQTADGDCSFPVERTDVTGTEVRVTEEPTRVVTLNPSAAQTMWEIGAREKVVGVTKHASNLDGAAAKTNISGAGQTINNEEVVGLEPDLVLAPNTVTNDTVEKLRDSGLTVYRFREAESIDDIKRKTVIIGELTGECAGAAETVEWMESRLATVDQAVEGAQQPDAIYVFYSYTSGQNTFIHTLIERAGGDNIAADAGIKGYKPVNQEVIVNRNPEWILLNDDWDEVPNNAAYNSTTAVREDNVLVINKNHLNRPGPRVVYALTTMAETFHPEAYAAANTTDTTAASSGTDTAVETATETATGTAGDGQSTMSTPAEQTTGGGSPGFGAVVALLALVVLTAGAVGAGRER
ncbi:PGF-CTERM-anchored ABC transporter substrate-binding protein [Salinirussus salinus]|jgi:iron complex transport system substrate-binding protein|uniref:PGF-CTERM-anchored ABC transporter substrate-binding protein n=1 Tax=Salinirussus salinus TaxID=1198300 RepID=UPI00135C5166|nr:PGF-CTERM-anchored ABC transporter substrate-binding protein [Salinirussus salinus]